MAVVEISGKLPRGLSDARLEKLAEISYKIMGRSGRAAVSVSVVDDAEIRRLNRRWRGSNRTTDVLSFGYGEDRGFQVSAAAGRIRHLGDIVISLPQVRRQAKDVGRPASQEFGLLFVHGLLHLLGLDHDSPQKESLMFGLQQEILMRAGVL